MSRSSDRYDGQERRKRSLVGKSDTKKPFGRLTHRWKYDVKKWNEKCIGFIWDNA
jgi:hypothetical protein